jgi:hypothetical protein
MATTKKKVRRIRRRPLAERQAHWDALEAAQEARAERESAAKERKDLAIAAGVQRATMALEDFVTTMRQQSVTAERRAQELHEAQLRMMSTAQPFVPFVPGAQSAPLPRRPRPDHLRPVDADTEREQRAAADLSDPPEER